MMAKVPNIPKIVLASPPSYAIDRGIDRAHELLTLSTAPDFLIRHAIEAATPIIREDTIERLGSAAHNAVLLDALDGLLGLIQLICSRDDMPSAIRQAVEENHRVETARIVSTKAHGEA